MARPHRASVLWAVGWSQGHNGWHWGARGRSPERSTGCMLGAARRLFVIVGKEPPRPLCCFGGRKTELPSNQVSLLQKTFHQQITARSPSWGLVICLMHDATPSGVSVGMRINSNLLGSTEAGVMVIRRDCLLLILPSHSPSRFWTSQRGGSWRAGLLPSLPAVSSILFVSRAGSRGSAGHRLF